MNHQTDRTLAVLFVSTFYLIITTAIVYGWNNEPNETSNSYFGSSQISSLKEQFAKSKTQQQGNGLQAVETARSLLMYQNPEIGITFQYPSEWKKPLDVNSDRCNMENECVLSFTFYLFLQNPKNGDPAVFDYSEVMKFYFVAIQATNLRMPRNFSDPCNCTELEKFVSWDYRTDYNRIFKEQKFITDNLTKFKNNRSAWQMETESKDVHSKYYVVWMVNGDFGYRFIYYGPRGDHFAKYLGGFKEVLNSLNFTKILPNMVPSFLKSSNFTSSAEELASFPDQNSTTRITSSSDFIDSAGYLHVVGEVENISIDDANFVKIIGTFYDRNNRVVGTENVYANPSTIGPGQSAPFELILISSSVPHSLIDHYKLSITK